MPNPYKRSNRTTEKPVRLVFEMPGEDVDAIDAWGVPAGMGSRAAAMRQLIKEGLKSATARPQGDVAR